MDLPKQPLPMTKYKAIIFDFDGVILESMNIKTEAFRVLFQDYPDHVDAIVDYHIENGGISRFVKFEYIYREMLNLPFDDAKSKELGEEFSRIVLEAILKCPFVEGAHEFLQKYSSEIPFFVASGTPHEELKLIVEERGLAPYFKGVYGTPALKPEIIHKILDEEGFAKEEVAYVGDAFSDYGDAQKAEVPFIGRTIPGEPNPFQGLNVPLIKDLNDLEKIVP